MSTGVLDLCTKRLYGLARAGRANNWVKKTVTEYDEATNTVLESQSASSFSNGVYKIWNISGHVKVTVTKTAGNNCVVLQIGGSR